MQESLRLEAPSNMEPVQSTYTQKSEANYDLTKTLLLKASESSSSRLFKLEALSKDKLDHQAFLNVLNCVETIGVIYGEITSILVVMTSLSELASLFATQDPPPP